MTVEKNKIMPLDSICLDLVIIFCDSWAVISLTIKTMSDQNWEGWQFVKTKYDNISGWDTNKKPGTPVKVEELEAKEKKMSLNTFLLNY